MVKDAKVIQRGVNVQDNDLVVPPGTPQHAINIDYSRSGTASKRVGYESIYAGLPPNSIDASHNFSDSFNYSVQRDMFELFSRDRVLTINNGLVFAFDESTSSWFSVPVNLPHKFTIYDNIGSPTNSFFSGLGKMTVRVSQASVTVTNSVSPMSISQNTATSVRNVLGVITNDASTATDTPNPGFRGRLRNPSKIIISVPTAGDVILDDTSIRKIDGFGTVWAGSVTASGDSTVGLGLFSGVSWGCVSGNNLYVADNLNQIKRITNAQVVSVFAGSITAGDVDGVGTAARFRNISGMVSDGGNFIYVTEGTGSHRVRKIDVTTGSVTIFAGSLTPTPGYLDANGTSARFSTPTGIERVGSAFYIGDSGNSRIRTMDSSANIGTLNKTSISASDISDGMIGGNVSSSILPGVAVRAKFNSDPFASTAFGQGTYLVIECTPVVTTGTVDCAIVDVTPGVNLSDQNVYHYARCPSSFANQTTGPNKLDTVGPNSYTYCISRASDAGNGIAISTSERPRIIDYWSKLSSSDAMPRFRSLGILQPEAPIANTTTGSNFTANSSWAYRTLCGLKLPNGKISLGPPSERVVVTSGGSAVSGSITAFPSPGLSYDGMPFIQIYRTKTFSSSVDPGDQMFLCYEAPLTYGNGIVVTDISVDSLLGQELYTNQTQGGFASSSLPPPVYVYDLCSFNQSIALCNYNNLSYVRVKLLGTSGLVAGTSTVTFVFGPSGVWNFNAYTATAINGATNPNSSQFQIATGGTSSQNTVQTARNIVSCINRSPDAYWLTAYYDENDPGSIVITFLFPGTSIFGITNRSVLGVSNKTNVQSSLSFSTNAPSNFFTVQQNISARQSNSIVYSDVNSFDSFPAVNSFTVGSNVESIQRILPLADRILAVKDDSIWSIDQTYSPQIYDAALTTSFPGSFSKLNNQWIGLFSRGFCSLNSTQAVAIGRNIDRDVIAQINTTNLISNFVSSAAIDVYGNYICTVNDRTFCYNIFSQSWSEWQVNTFVTQPSDVIVPSVSAHSRISGIAYNGAFRDMFMNGCDFPRGMLKQRDWRRNSPSVPSQYYKNFSDQAYSFSGVLAADLKTISVASYSANTNPGTLPPASWSIPAGAGPALVGASFPWSISVTSGGTTKFTQASVVAANESSPTSAVTITATLPLSGIAAGSVTVQAFPPILSRVQYAPSVSPGGNVNFGDVVLTVERSQPGPLAARFFNRLDYGSASVTAVGAFTNNYGVARMVMMPSITTSDSGISPLIVYNDVQRIPTPSERSFDQQLIVELWEGSAWQPLAIKSFVVEERVLNNGKIKQ